MSSQGKISYFNVNYLLIYAVVDNIARNWLLKEMLHILKNKSYEKLEPVEPLQSYKI